MNSKKTITLQIFQETLIGRKASKGGAVEIQ